jgi:anti-sigma regulatory factor (Ser/Thr protein kinase)
MVRDTGSWRDKRGEHRGRGLTIIEDLMDDVAVESADGGTLVACAGGWARTAPRDRSR